MTMTGGGQRISFSPVFYSILQDPSAQRVQRTRPDGQKIKTDERVGLEEVGEGK